MRPANRLALVRIGTVAIVAAAWAVGLFAPRPHELPGPALGSPLLWRAEIASAVLLALLFVLVVLIRGWRGELPNVFSERGAAWPEVTQSGEETGDRLDEIQAQ